MRLKLPKLMILILAAMLAGAGCAGQQKSQKEKAQAQWNGARASVLYGLARDQYQNGNFDKCKQTLNDAIRMDPTNARLHTLAAKLAIEQSQLELAERELQLARTADPKDAEPDYLSGVVCQRWQKPQAAFDYYSSASEKAPTELSYVLAKAEMLVAMDRSAEALALLQDKVLYFEHSAVIRDAAGQLLVQQKRYAEAVEMLRAASILATDDQAIREHLAMAMYFNKQYREASDVFARLLKDPKSANRTDLYLAQGECQMETNRATDARGSFETASRIDPTSVPAWVGLTKAALQLGDLKRAELALRKAASLDATSAETYLLIGYVRLRQNKLPDALKAFQQASKLDRRDTVSLCMIGYVLEKTGRGEQAIQYYHRALKIKPDDEMASRLITSADLRE